MWGSLTPSSKPPRPPLSINVSAGRGRGGRYRGPRPERLKPSVLFCLGRCGGPGGPPSESESARPRAGDREPRQAWRWGLGPPAPWFVPRIGTPLLAATRWGRMGSGEPEPDGEGGLRPAVLRRLEKGVLPQTHTCAAQRGGLGAPPRPPPFPREAPGAFALHPQPPLPGVVGETPLRSHPSVVPSAFRAVRPAPRPDLRHPPKHPRSRPQPLPPAPLAVSVDGPRACHVRAALQHVAFHDRARGLPVAAVSRAVASVPGAPLPLAEGPPVERTGHVLCVCSSAAGHSAVPTATAIGARLPGASAHTWVGRGLTRTRGIDGSHGSSAPNRTTSVTVLPRPHRPVPAAGLSSSLAPSWWRQGL